MEALLERAAPLEVRVSGRTLRTEVPYGERARDRDEMLAPRALEPVEPVTLNVQHFRPLEIASTADGSLRLRQGSESMGLEADLQGTREDGPLGLVTRGALRGVSPEMRVWRESMQATTRIVERAGLEAFGLVDIGSYATPLELRRLSSGAWFTASIPMSRPGGGRSRLQCECSGPTCDDVEFLPGSFDDLGSDGDVLAVGGGGYGNVLGSLKRGTLEVEQRPDELRIGLTERGTATAQKIADDARAAPIYARPVLDLDTSEYEEVERVRRFSKASVRAFLIKPTPHDRGHTPATIDGVESRSNKSGRRLWL